MNFSIWAVLNHWETKIKLCVPSIIEGNANKLPCIWDCRTITLANPEDDHDLAFKCPCNNLMLNLARMPKLTKCRVKVNYVISAHYSNYYNCVIMSTMASQIASLTSVYSTFYSGADQRKYQSPASPVTGEFPAQKARNEENVSIWWSHHVHKMQRFMEMISGCNLSEFAKPSKRIIWIWGEIWAKSRNKVKQSGGIIWIVLDVAHSYDITNKHRCVTMVGSSNIWALASGNIKRLVLIIKPQVSPDHLWTWQLCCVGRYNPGPVTLSSAGHHCAKLVDCIWRISVFMPAL